MRFKPFIFNWPGQFERVQHLEQEFRKLQTKIPELLEPSVINSDVANYVPHWISVGNHYFATQLYEAVQRTPKGTALLHVQGDVSYDHWEPLVERMLEAADKHRWGIVAPNVTKIYWDHLGNMQDLDGGFTEVLHTDCTVWAIHPSVLEQMRKQLYCVWKNSTGWGIDIVMRAVCRLQKRLVIRDYSHTVQHHGGTDYCIDLAFDQYLDMIRCLPPELLEQMQWFRDQKLQRFFSNL